MIDEARRAIHDAPLPWDEMRERRVLSRIEAQRRARPRQAPRRRTVMLLGAAGALAAAAIIASIGFFMPPIDSTPALASLDTSPALQAPPAIPFARPATMALADGSVAQLDDGARVDVDIQTESLVRLVHRTGTVKYRVAPNPGRQFVVDAAGVEVKVIGTVFTVTLADEQVSVAVERGRVAVESMDRTAELGAGDELRLDAEPETTLVVVDEDVGPARKPAPTQAAPKPSVEELLARADAARAGGRLADAAAALREMTAHHGKDPRTYASWFQLGKVERARGKHAAAAKAFARCFKRSPTGALSEDARAESAVSWQAAGNAERARKEASAYLKRYPSGAHAARMRRILDRTQ